MPSINEVLLGIRKRFRYAAIEDAGREAGLILGMVLEMDLTGLVTFRDRLFPEEKQGELEALVQRRLGGEPVQYILGEWEFMGLPFRVTPAALIPRQDTETLVEQGLDLVKSNGCRTALDLCCGTGCVGISMAALGGLEVTMSDLSPACVALSRENAEKNGVLEHCCFCQGDLFQAVPGQRFDMILSNPPYLADGEFAYVQRELLFEPRMALAGGPDGLDFYRRIAGEYRDYLNPGGVLLMEVGWLQAKTVQSFFPGPTLVQDDLNGVARVVIAMA